MRAAQAAGSEADGVHVIAEPDPNGPALHLGAARLRLPLGVVGHRWPTSDGPCGRAVACSSFGGEVAEAS